MLPECRQIEACLPRFPYNHLNLSHDCYLILPGFHVFSIADSLVRAFDKMSVTSLWRRAGCKHKVLCNDSVYSPVQIVLALLEEPWKEIQLR